MDLNQLIHFVNRVLCNMPQNNPMRGELEQMLFNLKEQRSQQYQNG
jgi:hypothetical protein